MTQTASQAVSQWMEEHGGKIYGLGLRLCGSPEAAEDLVQETFLQAFRNWERFEGRPLPPPGCSPSPAVSASARRNPCP